MSGQAIARTAVAVALVLAAGCGRQSTPPRPRPWTVAWWYWAPPEGARPIDGPRAPRVYVQVVRSGGPPWRLRWPPDVPDASEYAAVIRIEGTRLPDDADGIARDVAALRVGQGFSPASPPPLRPASPPPLRVGQGFSPASRSLRALQIDFDCPTASLPAYGRFLAHLRERLPRDMELSVTALLDWFREPGAAALALAAVDEFVPQFYDLDPDGASPGIAEPVTQEWAARFDRAERPYRVGIATFGRIERVRGAGPGSRAASRDLAPFDLVARLPVRGGAASRTPAGELVVPFVVRGPGGPALLEGDRIEMILPTAASVHDAYEAARRLGGWCSGIVCFRWPWKGEDLVARPREALTWIEHGTDLPGAASLGATDGGCAPLRCLDLVLAPQARFAHETVRYAIVSSAPVAYVEPSAPGVLVSHGGSRLEAVVPAWSGGDRVPLGRVFTRTEAHVALAR